MERHHGGRSLTSSQVAHCSPTRVANHIHCRPPAAAALRQEQPQQRAVNKRKQARTAVAVAEAKHCRQACPQQGLRHVGCLCRCKGQSALHVVLILSQSQLNVCTKGLQHASAHRSRTNDKDCQLAELMSSRQKSLPH